MGCTHDRTKHIQEAEPSPRDDEELYARSDKVVDGTVSTLGRTGCHGSILTAGNATSSQPLDSLESRFPDGHYSGSPRFPADVYGAD